MIIRLHWLKTLKYDQKILDVSIYPQKSNDVENFEVWKWTVNISCFEIDFIKHDAQKFNVFVVNDKSKAFQILIISKINDNASNYFILEHIFENFVNILQFSSVYRT